MTISLVSGLRNTLLTLVANSNTPKALLSEWGIGEEEIKLARRIIQPEYVIWSPSMLSPDGISKIQKPIPTRYSLLELFLSILLKAPNPRLQDLSQELIPCYSMQSHEIPAQPKCGIGEGEFEIVRRIIKPECVICTLPISMLLGIQILIPKKPIPTRDFLLKHFLSKRPNPRLQGVSQELIPCCPKQSQEIPGESEEAFEGRIPICKWEVNIETTNFQFGGLTHTSPKQVYLFREQDALTYQVFEPWSKTTWSGPIPTEGRPIEEVISYLMLCQPVMDSEGTPSFRKPFHKSTDGDTEVSIIRAEDRLVWHVYRTTQKRGRDIYEKDFAVFLSQTSRCTKETAACIRNIQSLPMQERLNSLRDFKIVSSSTFPINQVINLVFLQNLLPLNPFCFNLEPQVVEKSRLDERVLVSKFQWAVALFAFEGSEGNHANILVEGVDFKDRKGYFMHLSHFTGAKVEANFISPDDLVYQQRTEQWKRSSMKVKKMLQNIERQCTRVNRPKFEKKGSDSILGNGGHSCITWAREQFYLIDIDLGHSIVGFIATRTKNYTQPPAAYNGSRIWSKIEQRYKPFCDNAELI